MYAYVTKLYAFSGTKVSIATISKWFHTSFKFKATCHKPSIFPDQKFSEVNIRKLNYYVNLVIYFDHTWFVFTDEKPMRGVDIYNKKVCRSPLTGSVLFVDTGFDIHTVYHLMAAIKIGNGTSTNSESNISYQIRKFQGTLSAFNYFVTELVGTGFLRPGHILVYQNVTIHLAEENHNLAEIHWEQYRI